MKMTPERDGAVRDIRSAATIVDLIDVRMRLSGDRPSFTYLADGESEQLTRTYGELRSDALAIAARLQELCDRGDRALLVVVDPIEFITAFLACQAAGVIAVPVFPPMPMQGSSGAVILRGIAADSGASVVVIGDGEEFQRYVQDAAPELKALSWLSVDEVGDDSADFQPVSLTGDDISFLQYTSGSTGAPKGVVVSHGNLIHNEELIRQSFGIGDNEICVAWLPLYHDMGLIGNILQTLYAGMHTFVMSPLTFIQRPVRWLKAISVHGAVISGGPNFAYDLCVRRVPDDAVRELDLSSWRVAFNGAEPIRSSVLDAFTEKFAPAGFDPRAWYPCYGLAESTLFATGGRAWTGRQELSVDLECLQRGRLVPGGEHRLVSCGQPRLHRDLEIVDPDTSRRVPEGQVGEIWLSGPDVAHGYWGDAERETFDAHLDTGEGPFLRTGDLGAVFDGELYVAGRRKDLLIIGGRNHYPQDVETTAENADPAIRRGCCAAFAVDGERGEHAVLIAEVNQRTVLDPAAIASRVRGSVSAHHGIRLDEVVLAAPRTVGKTSSGKVRRGACKTAWQRGELQRIDEVAPTS